MAKVVVTGGSGGLGTWVIRDLLAHGYDVINIDASKPRERLCRFILGNVRNAGDLFYAFRGADAIIHLAAIPSPGGHPDTTVLENNVASTYCVLDTASAMGIQNVAIASSICAYGMVNAYHPFVPNSLPLTEEHPLMPQDSYGLSKVHDETSALSIHRRCGTQVVSLRFTTVITPEMYAKFTSVVQSHWLSERVLWSYIDVRDAASACRLAIEVQGLGAIALNIGAVDTGVPTETNDLIQKYFSGVPLRESFSGNQTLFSIDKAKQALAWSPEHRWRDHV